MYHELLWAWAVRAQGDPERARSAIRSRIGAEALAGRPVAMDWVEVLRCAELAQCEMDLGEMWGDMAARGPEVERLLWMGECWAGELGPDWPSVRLVAEARGRFLRMGAEGGARGE